MKRALRRGRGALQPELRAEVREGVSGRSIGKASESIGGELSAGKRDAGCLEAQSSQPARGSRGVARIVDDEQH